MEKWINEEVADDFLVKCNCKLYMCMLIISQIIMDGEKL